MVQLALSVDGGWSVLGFSVAIVNIVIFTSGDKSNTAVFHQTGPKQANCQSKFIDSVKM
jgi:hypothetical protein